MSEITQEYTTVVHLTVVTRPNEWVARIKIDGVNRASAISRDSAADAINHASLMVPFVLTQKHQRGPDEDPT